MKTMTVRQTADALAEATALARVLDRLAGMHAGTWLGTYYAGKRDACDLATGAYYDWIFEKVEQPNVMIAYAANQVDDLEQEIAWHLADGAYSADCGVDVAITEADAEQLEAAYM